jgi:hypothetical protein
MPICPQISALAHLCLLSYKVQKYYSPMLSQLRRNTPGLNVKENAHERHQPSRYHQTGEMIPYAPMQLLILEIIPKYLPLKPKQPLPETAPADVMLAQVL